MIICGLNVSENVYSGHTCKAKKVLKDLVIFLIYELVKAVELNLLNVKICRWCLLEKSVSGFFLKVICHEIFRVGDGQWTPMNRSVEEMKPLVFRDFSDLKGKSLEVNAKSRWLKISRSPINLC
jgi:hypothetical protein